MKQTWEISLIVICTWYLTLAGLRERERIRPREDGWSAFYGSFEKKLFQKKLSKTFGGYDKISYLCIRLHARIGTEKRKGPIRIQQTKNKKRRKNGRQTCKLAKLAALPHPHTCAYIIMQQNNMFQNSTLFLYCDL